MIELPRESVEFIPIAVHVDGLPVTQGVDVATTTGSGRPAAWASATSLDGRLGLLVDGLPVGEHTVWVRITDAPEAPVLECERIRIT